MTHASPARAAGGVAPVLAAFSPDDLPEPLREVAATALEVDRIGIRSAEAFADDLRDAFGRAMPELRDLLADLAGSGGTLTQRIDAVSLAAAEADIADLLGDSGLREAVAELTQAHADVLAQSVAAVESAGVPATALSLDLELLEALRDLDLERWVLYGEDLSWVARRAVLDNATTGRTLDSVADAVQEALDSTRASAARDARTMLQAYSRRTNEHIAESAGLEHFLYVGPDDGLTRPFCLPLVGKVLTEEQIRGLANGQIEPPMIHGGGFNCRHHWQPVPAPPGDGTWPEATSSDVATADRSGS